MHGACAARSTAARKGANDRCTRYAERRRQPWHRSGILALAQRIRKVVTSHSGASVQNFTQIFMITMSVRHAAGARWKAVVRRADAGRVSGPAEPAVSAGTGRSAGRAAGEVPRRPGAAPGPGARRGRRGTAACTACVPTPSTAPGPSACGYDWVNRKLRSGRVISPFSISQTPLRVRPVITSVRGSSTRVYQWSVTSSPRDTSATSAATVESAAGPSTSVDRRVAGAGGSQRQVAAATAPQPRPAAARGRSTSVPASRAVRRSCDRPVGHALVDDRRPRACGVPSASNGSPISPGSPRRRRGDRRVELLPRRLEERPPLVDRLAVEAEHRQAACSTSATAVGSSTTSYRPGGKLDRRRRRPGPWPPPARRAPRRRGRSDRRSRSRADPVATTRSGRCRPSRSRRSRRTTAWPAELANAARDVPGAAVAGGGQAAGRVDEGADPLGPVVRATRPRSPSSTVPRGRQPAPAGARPGQPGSSGASRAAASVRSTKPRERVGAGQRRRRRHRSDRRRAAAAVRSWSSSATFWWIIEFANRVSASVVVLDEHLGLARRAGCA